ncbi:MAG: hypothetical protein HY721_35720 [Planctomycetes bacterium]|nr:hypothetical protein [Planctomycetota bacterium]
MGTPTPRARWLACTCVLLYAGGLVAPQLHETLLEEEACVSCAMLLDLGPRLEPSCEGPGPCPDPGHHHHHGRPHDHGQCPACGAKVLGLGGARPAWAVPAAGAAAPVRQPAPGLDGHRVHPSPPARAPPAIS